MPWSCYFFFYFGALYSDLQFIQGTLQAAEENCLEGFVCNYIFLRERKGKKGTFWELKVLSPFPSTNNKQFCLFKCKGLGTWRVELREFKSEARHWTHWQCSHLEVPNPVPNSADITGLFHQDYLSYQGIYFPLPVCGTEQWKPYDAPSQPPTPRPSWLRTSQGLSSEEPPNILKNESKN